MKDCDDTRTLDKRPRPHKCVILWQGRRLYAKTTFLWLLWNFKAFHLSTPYKISKLSNSWVTQNHTFFVNVASTTFPIFQMPGYFVSLHAVCGRVHVSSHGRQTLATSFFNHTTVFPQASHTHRLLSLLKIMHTHSKNVCI